MKRLVLFRVDAGSQIGLGHLMRCLALAQALEQQGLESMFLINAEAVDVCKRRHDWVGRYQVIPASLSLEQEGQWLARQLQREEPWAMVVDGYQFNESYRRVLKKTNVPLIVFDDNNNSGALHADMVLNAAGNAGDLGYDKTAENALLCLGQEYRILRQEFIYRPYVTWSQRHSLTLVFGGSDVLGLTLPLLALLQQRQVDFPIRVITGAAYARLTELNSFIQRSTLSIQHLHDCQQVAEVFSYSKLVVSAAGGSQFELMACETPTILVAVADNQLNATRQATEQGWCLWQDFTQKQNLNELADAICNLWQDEGKLKEMNQKAGQFLDLSGADKVVQAIAGLR